VVGLDLEMRDLNKPPPDGGTIPCIHDPETVQDLTLGIRSPLGNPLVVPPSAGFVCTNSIAFSYPIG
jgi:hypothetical protein